MLIGILVFFTVLIFWQFLGYPLFMAAIYRRHKGRQENKDYSYRPFVSIIVPTYNEAPVIERRINNLLSQEYPDDKFEVIIVDSGSTDDSPVIAGEIGRNNPNVKVLEEGERRGKASAINLGKSIAKGDIILVTDANTMFDINVLKEITPHFRNPEIGAVGGRFIPDNTNNKLAGISGIYWELESLMRRGESAWSSACLFHGEINAWRRDIIEADTESLAEDLDMSVTISKKGYRIVYEPNAIAYEPVPTTKRELLIQKKRSAIGTIQSFFKHKNYLLLPRNRYAGIVFPSHKTLQIFSPFIIIGHLITMALLMLQQMAVSISAILTIVLLFSVALAILSRVLSSYRITGGTAAEYPLLKDLLNIVLYVLLHEYIILLAWKDYAFKNYQVEWEKVQSTRYRPKT